MVARIARLWEFPENPRLAMRRTREYPDGGCSATSESLAADGWRFNNVHARVGAGDNPMIPPASLGFGGAGHRNLWPAGVQDRIARINFRPDHAMVTKKKAQLTNITVTLLLAGERVRATSAPGLRLVCTRSKTVAGGAPRAFSTPTTAYCPRTSTIRLTSPLRPFGVSAIVSCSLPRLNNRNSLIGSNSTCTLPSPRITSKWQSTSEGVCRTVRGTQRKSPGSSRIGCAASRGSLPNGSLVANGRLTTSGQQECESDKMNHL